MDRSEGSPKRTIGRPSARGAVWLALVIAITAACSPVEPSPTATLPSGSPTSGPTGSPSASPTSLTSSTSSTPPSASPAATLDAALACPLTSEPGPGDEPPRGGGDLLDLTDFGPGRYRLCIVQPLVGSFEHTAWCNWTDDRSTVRDVNGLPMRIDDVAYDAWVALDGDEFQLSTTDARGYVSTYLADARNQLREVEEDGRAGHVAFAVAIQVDPESSPHPGAPPGFIGAMGWTCGDPPPPR